MVTAHLLNPHTKILSHCRIMGLGIRTMSEGVEVLVPGMRGHFYILSRSDGEVHMTAEGL